MKRVSVDNFSRYTGYCHESRNHISETNPVRRPITPEKKRKHLYNIEETTPYSGCNSSSSSNNRSRPSRTSRSVSLAMVALVGFVISFSLSLSLVEVVVVVLVIVAVASVESKSHWL